MRYLLLSSAIPLALLAGCSGTSLRCGTDGDSSYVELVNVPQDLTSAVRHYRDLCGFNYGVDDGQASQDEPQRLKAVFLQDRW